MRRPLTARGRSKCGKAVPVAWILSNPVLSLTNHRLKRLRKAMSSDERTVSVSCQRSKVCRALDPEASPRNKSVGPVARISTLVCGTGGPSRVCHRAWRPAPTEISRYPAPAASPREVGGETLTGNDHAARCTLAVPDGMNSVEHLEIMGRRREGHQHLAEGGIVGRFGLIPSQDERTSIGGQQSWSGFHR